MIIIGVDFHPAFQQIASVDSESGELQEKRLAHPQEAEKFYGARLRRMANEDELLLQTFETIANRHETEWKQIWGNNAETGPLVYWRDVAPYKHLVRAIRLRLDQPICWGASDCLERALTQCAAGKHETCERHQRLLSVQKVKLFQNNFDRAAPRWCPAL